MLEFLSPPETPKRCKSMSLHPTTDIDTRSIKQIGNYTLGAEVGSGAFGKVVLGKHFLTGETVAIKILDKMILSQTPEDYELVRQEISILKIVKHKYIVQLYEILQTPQHIFIVMEYCEGKDLMDYILTKTRLSELESLKFFQQLINALFYLHSQNISHRDVKIDNMLLDRNKDLKLVDFGLSTKYTDDTLLDQPCGTVVYAAPEVLDGNEYHGMLADVWSSGIVLFGMVSGYLPFCDQDDEVNKKHVLEGKIDLPEFFSPMLKDLLRHMLDINPITRYTLQDIREHPWFNMNDSNLIPGIIIGYNLIPVDDNILNLCVAYNCDKDKVEFSVKNNKYDAGSALYYLLVRKLTRKGFESISDLSSELFIDFILDDNNLVKNERDKKSLNNNDTNNNNSTKLKVVNNSSTQIIKSNSTSSHRTNTNHDTLSTSNNNKEIFPSSSRHMNDLGAAPGLLPQTNDSRLDKFNLKKDKLLETNKRTNKVISAPKNKQYNNAASKGNNNNNNKTLMESKNRLKPQKNNLLKKNNYDNNNKRLNNSAQHRQINNKNNNDNNNKKENMNKFKNLKNKNKINNINNNRKINNNQTNDLNLQKEQSINMNNIEKEGTVIYMINKDDPANDMGKATYRGADESTYKENFKNEEFKSNTEKTNNEIRNNIHKNNQTNNKTPIKNTTKSITKEIKDTTFSAYQNTSKKFNKKCEFNKINNQNQKNKNNLKNKKDANNNSIILNHRYLKKDKEKGEKYLGHSCIDINPSDYLKTMNKKPKVNNGNNGNGNIGNNTRSSYKNLISNNGKKVLLEEIKKQKGITTNIISSDKFDNKTYNNKKIYNKNKTNNINNNTNHYISKSIHTTYNPRYGEMEKIEENTFLFSSNKKKDYSLCKKNHVVSVQNLNHSKFEKSENLLNNSMSTKYKKFDRNRMTHKNLSITSPINKLNSSMNNNYNTNKSYRFKNGIYSSVPKKKKPLDYDPNNTIYEFNYKSKNKNRIRLDFNPNKQYELTANDNNNNDKRKKNKLNNSVTIGKTDDKKITRLTRYLNNYNRQYTKPAHLESSVITHRKIQSNTIRELSYSPNQKYLNEKTRKKRIPWKIQKKGIDDKLTSETIYNKYLKKINKYNPLKPYGNKKIKNNINKNNRNIYYKNNINLHNRTLKSIKDDTKLLNQTSVDNKNSLKHFEGKFTKNSLNKTNIDYKENEKEKIKSKIKEKKIKRLIKHKAKCLSNENIPPQTFRLKPNKDIYNSSYLNNNFNDNFNTTFNNKGVTNSNFAVSNSVSLSSIASKKELFLNMLNNKTNIFDLSSLIIEAKTLIDCNQYLTNKLKKKGFSTISSKQNKIKCSKNDIYFDIDIYKIENHDSDKNLNSQFFYYKIKNIKGGIGVNKIISKTLLSA